MTNQLDYIRDHLQAAIESSARSRRILVLLIAASILVFVGFWNSRDASWITTHLRWAQEIESQFKRPPVGSLSKEQESVKKRAVAYQIENVEEAKHFHQHLLDLMADHVLYLRAPILGLAFDINDLGIFSGITFLVLLWSRFSLWHEWNNLRLCFDESKPEDRHDVYRYLQMRQLLTIPPPLYQDERWERIFWDRLALGLFLMPAIIYGIIVIYDILTAFSLPAAEGKTVEIYCEVACLAFVISLSVLCVILLFDTDKTWRKFALDVRSGEPREAG